jgi:hypothetical protein
MHRKDGSIVSNNHKSKTKKLFDKILHPRGTHKPKRQGPPPPNIVTTNTTTTTTTTTPTTAFSIDKTFASSTPTALSQRFSPYPKTEIRFF